MIKASKISSPEALIAALQANNPFEKPPVVKEQNIWGESFPDVLSLNAHASDAVFEALARVRAATSSLEKSTSIVFTADRGVGKSHLIRRIRKRLQADGQTLFIYASADKYSNLDFINCSFQQSVAESLEQFAGREVSQWQEVAALMVSDALRASNPKAKVPSAEDLAARFDKAYQNSRARGKDLVTDLTKAIRRLKSNADPYIIRAMLWTLSEERGPLAVKWLAGEQLDAQDAIDLRLPSNGKSEQEREANALSVVAEILSLIEEYRAVLICFDELDTIAADGNGFPTVSVIADLVRKLFSSVRQSHNAQGFIILTVLLPDLWTLLTQTRETSIDKVSTYGKAIDLKNIDIDSLVELTSLWLGQFYKAKNLVPPTSIYPFEKDELIQYAKRGPYVREALKWCATQINEKCIGVIDPGPITPKEKLKRAYRNALEQLSNDYLDDNDAIASVLSFCFQKIIDIEKINNMLIENVVVKGIEEVMPKAKNNGYINFKLVGVENDETVTIGVEVLQQTHGLSVGAGFRRLLDRETFGLSRGCLVRSRERKLKRNWDSYEYYQQLIAQGGEWVDLKEDEIKPLLALQYVYDHHEKFDLTVKRLDSFAFTQKLLTENPLIKEILSRPAGNLSEEALEGEELQHLHSDEELQELAATLSQSLEDSTTENADEQLDLADLEVA